jgi:predicted PurR-regulated permease PerM
VSDVPSADPGNPGTSPPTGGIPSGAPGASPAVAEPAAAGPAQLVLQMGEGRQLPRWFWRAVVAVGVSFAVYQIGRSVIDRLTGLLVIIAISLFLSFAVEPAVNHLADRGWRRSRATLFCFAMLFAVGGVFIFVMGELVVSQVSDLVTKAPEYVTDASRWINDTFGTDITTDKITEELQNYQDDVTDLARNVGGRVLTVTGAVVGIVFQAFTVALFAYYMTSQGPLLRRNVCSLLPQRNQRTVLLLWELAIQKTGGWIYSRLLLAVFAASGTWVFLSILGVPSPLALALWVGLISQFIPAIGTYLAGALPVLIALLNDPIDAVWVLGFIILYQQVENYFLSPKVTAHTMDLHPAVAFGSALAGATLLGGVGAIMALPAAATIQAFVSTFLRRHEVVASHLTELERVQEEEGQKGFRQALKRIARSEESEDAGESGTGGDVEHASTAVDVEEPPGDGRPRDERREGGPGDPSGPGTTAP